MSAALSREHFFAVAYVAVAAIFIMWDLLLAGRIAQLRRVPRTFAAITAFAGLLLVPALIIAYSTASIIYGRAIYPVAWVWPLTAGLFALQAIYALSRRLVTPLFGVPVVVYNAIIAIVAISRFVIGIGGVPPDTGLALSAAQASALGFFFGPEALWGAAYLMVPVFSPSLPARWRASGFLRAIIAATAAAIAALVLIEVPSAFETTNSYTRYSKDQLQEHPEGDFAIGLKILPDLYGPPPPVALENDVALADSVGVDAIEIEIAPQGTRLVALDSLARTVVQQRGDSTLIIVALSYPKDATRQFRESPSEYTRKRLANIDRIARQIRPDILIPAEEPYGAGARAIGVQEPGYWIDYFSRAAKLAHFVNPRIRVGLGASSYGTRDSTLYTWAVSRNSPIDIVGFSMMPGFDGARSLDTRMRIATRWMRQLSARPKPHWVFAAGGFPQTHGEESQALAIWGVLSWATTQSPIKGLVVVEAGDYDAIRGLRAPGGRLRSAVGTVIRAERGLRETVAR
ncbi:MAG TPA: hypothetical protein VIF83_02080 [Gemmatimonadaceae bacterium]